MAREPWLWSSGTFPLPCSQSSPPTCFAHFSVSPNQHMWSQWLKTTHSHPLIHQILIEYPPSAQHFGYTDKFNTHLDLKELIVYSFSASITACEKSPHVASTGQINKLGQERHWHLFLALLWLNVVPTSLSLIPMLVTGCRKVMCAGEWHHFFLFFIFFFFKGVYASLPILKFCDCMILN